MEVVFAWVTEFADHVLPMFGLLFGLAFANVFVPPVPIETISLFVGYLLAEGHGDLAVAWSSLAGGMATGSTLLYYLACTQGKRLFQLRWIQKQVTPQRLDQVEAWFHKRGLWIIFAGKLVPGMSFATVLAVGLFGTGRRRALSAIYLANLIYFGAALAIGYLLGENWHDVIDIGQRIWPWILAAVLVVLFTWGVLWQRSKQHQREKMH